MQVVVIDFDRYRAWDSTSTLYEAKTCKEALRRYLLEVWKLDDENTDVYVSDARTHKETGVCGLDLDESSIAAFPLVEV